MATSEENIKRLGETDELVNRLGAEISKSESELSDWKSRLVTYYELYNLVQRKGNYNGIAKIFVPETLRAVETVVGKMMEILFGAGDWFEYAGRDEYDSGSALAMTQLVRYQTDENDFEARVADSIRQMAITGLTVRKVGWEFDEKQRTKTAVDQDALKEKSTVDIIKDTWQLEPVDLFGFHISDIRTAYNDPQKARWMAEQRIVDKQWFRERKKRGWLTDVQAKKWEEEKAPSSEATSYRERLDASKGFTVERKPGEMEVIERWGLLEAKYVYTAEELKAKDLEADDMVETVAVIINRKGIAKLEANPFWHQMKPYVCCPYIPKENELGGMGIVQIGEKLQIELNDTRNQTMDNKTLVLMTMWLKSRTSGIKNSDLRIRANGVIQTNDMAGLQPLRPPVLTGVGVNIEGVVKEDLRQATGASSNLQGLVQSGVDTATESAFINKETLSRIMLVANTYGKLVLKRVLIMVEFLNYQFFDHVSCIRLIGAQGVKYRKMEPKDIAGGHKDVIIRVASDFSDNPAVKKQQSMAFFSIVQGMPPEQIEFHWKFLDKLYRQHFGGRSLSECYPAPVDQRDLLTPEDEVDLILAEQPVVAQEGADHQAALQFHIQEYGQMKYALTPVQNANYQRLIMSHQAALEAELQAQTAQFMMSQAAMAGEAAGPGSVNKGQMPNMGANTLTAAPNAPSTGNMRQGVGR